MSMEGEKWRLFIAVPLPDEVKNRLNDWCQKRQDELKFRKWVHPADYHITVQFLGDTPSSRVQAILEGLREAVSGIEPFQLEAAGIGAFGRPAQPSPGCYGAACRGIWLRCMAFRAGSPPSIPG